VIDVELVKLDEVFMKINCDDSILRELSEYFTFMTPNAKFDPRVRSGRWDGSICILKRKERKLYLGLKNKVTEFCKDNNYTLLDKTSTKTKVFTYEEVEKFTRTLNLPVVPYDYQIQAIADILNNNQRGLVISATSSGKSLLIYILFRLFNQKTVVVVPTKLLVKQMAKDFISYGYTGVVGQIMSDSTTDTDKHKLPQISVSTWQSLIKMPAHWFQQFKVICGDECIHPDTLITMGDNTKKAIKDIMVGEYVLTYNENTKIFEQKPVIKIHTNLSINEQMYEIQLSNNKVLKITGNHKVLLLNGYWKRADELEEGDLINTPWASNTENMDV
jgi:hypothetical protein